MNDTTPSCNPTSVGDDMHRLMAELFPICRSITGQGVSDTLAILQQHIPLSIREVPSGTKCFDWVVPDERNIAGAYIETPSGQKIADFKRNNLHVVGYSTPVDKELSLDELMAHVHSDPDLPDAIPYVTSYHQRR